MLVQGHLLQLVNMKSYLQYGIHDQQYILPNIDCIRNNLITFIFNIEFFITPS